MPKAGSRPGWRGSGKKFRFPQFGAPSRTDIADVSPCLSDLIALTALNERCKCVQERRLKLFALKQEVVRRGQLWRHERRPPPSSRQSCLRARKLCANLMAFIMAVIEATQVKPTATLLAQSIMHDACRNMRSWRARCLYCRCKCRRATRTRRGWRRRIIALDVLERQQTAGAASRRAESAPCVTLPCATAGRLMRMAALGRF